MFLFYFIYLVSIALDFACDFSSVLHNAYCNFWCICSLVNLLIYQPYSYTFSLQTHLLGMKGKLSPKATPLSFTELIIIVIKMLSGNDHTRVISGFLPSLFNNFILSNHDFISFLFSWIIVLPFFICANNYYFLDLCLRRSASPVSVDNKLNDPYIMVSDDSELDQLRDYKGTRFL